MVDMKINWVQKLEVPVECPVIHTINNSRISNMLCQIRQDDFVYAKGNVVAITEISDRSFDKLCFNGLTANDYPFVSKVYGRKRKIKINEVGRNEFEVICIENKKMDCVYMAVRQYGSIPLLSTQLLNLETFKAWEQKFEEMEKFVEVNQIRYLEDKLYSEPDLSSSSTDLILEAFRDGRDWFPSFEGGLSLYDIVIKHIISAQEKAAEQYLDNIYGRKPVQPHKEVKR